MINRREKEWIKKREKEKGGEILILILIDYL